MGIFLSSLGDKDYDDVHYHSNEDYEELDKKYCDMKNHAFELSEKITKLENENAKLKRDSDTLNFMLNPKKKVN